MGSDCGEELMLAQADGQIMVVVVVRELVLILELRGGTFLTLYGSRVWVSDEVNIKIGEEPESLRRGQS